MVQPPRAPAGSTARGSAYLLPREKPGQPGALFSNCAHRTRPENERRACFLGKPAHPPGIAAGNPSGVTGGFFLPSPAAPPSWWNSPVRAAKVSATCQGSTWAFSQATSRPWSKAFWSEWWMALHPTNPCAWRPSARPVSPLHTQHPLTNPPSSGQEGPGPTLQAANLVLPAGWAAPKPALKQPCRQFSTRKKGCFFGTICPAPEAGESFSLYSFAYLAKEYILLLIDSLIFPSKFYLVTLNMPWAEKMNEIRCLPSGSSLPSTGGGYARIFTAIIILITTIAASIYWAITTCQHFKCVKLVPTTGSLPSDITEKCGHGVEMVRFGDSSPRSSPYQ